MDKVLVLVIILVQYFHTEVSAGCDLPHISCERKYEKVGGFIEKDNRVMPELLLNDRDCTSDKNDGHKLDWYKFEVSIHSLACRCAEIAKKKGYKVFGLQFYGECWSGPLAEAKFAEYGSADPSKSLQLTGNPPPPCDKNNPQECVGGPLVNYVYRLKDDQQSADVDGGYSKWADWTKCSKTCGGGTKVRERTCTNPEPKGNGKDCSSLGPAEETAPCNQQACPDPDVDGKWSSWQAWSSCSSTCGGGVRVRLRRCDNPAPSGHGKKCQGPTEETGRCAEDPCPIPCIKALDIGIILDGSGSVQLRNFKIALGFIEDLITHFKVSTDGTHFGVITYNHRAQLQFTMADKRYHNFVDLKSKVKSIRYTGGWTRTDRALEMAASSLFTAAGGDRSDKPNILIVFTDGKTNRGSKAYAEVLRPLQQKGVRTLAVGIGSGINYDELLEIAMDNPHYVVKVDKFEHLKNKLDIILEDSCQGSPPTTPEPECTAEGLPLGMENRKIPTASLSASSIWDHNHGVDRARLNTKAGGGKTGAWSARYNDVGQYYQIDFGKAVKISKILTQGRQDYNQWVTSYSLSYSQDNGVYKPYVYERGKGKVIFSANKDRNTIKSNKLDVPIFARYLRIHPVRWYGHISMRLEIYGCTKGFNPPVVPTCLSALGLQSGAIKDSMITSSSHWDNNHRAANGRLYFQKVGARTGAWSARYNKANQWLQVDLGKMGKVRMVGTQGRADADQWVVNYWISYSRDGIFWERTDIFTGNSDRHSVVTNLIDPPIYGRYFRIHPRHFHRHISMRAELYGCTSGFVAPPVPCSDALGMKDRSIPDASITASSMWDANHGPALARLDLSRHGSKRGGWSAKSNDKGQWLQIKMNKISKITRIAIQGRQDYNQWVTSFTLKYSQDGGHYVDYQAGEILTGNHDRNTVKGHVLDPPIIARYIQVLPKSWYGHISMRMEVYGCTSGFQLPPPPSCLKALGVQSKAIKDAQMIASSEWDSNHGASNGRLHFQRAGRKTGAWSALRNNRYQWLGVVFGNVVKLTMFATQGRQDHPQWVKTYKIEYSLDGYEYKTYSIKGQPKIFGGNSDQHNVVTHLLTESIYARYVRIVPITWHRHISMRLEFYGCNEGFVPPNVHKCRSPLGLESGLVKDGQMTASSQWNHAHRASNARLYFHRGRGRTGGWSSRHNNPTQWLQVEFKNPTKIVAVGTQGREDYNQWVTKYSLQYSEDGIFWRDYTNKADDKSKLFNGNADRYSVVRHMLEEPIIARFVRFQPKTWYRHISMRAELYGCRQGFAVPKTPCFTSLGLKSKGSFPDSKITASSQWDSNHSPAQARLDTIRSGRKTGAWSAKANDKGQWIQADLGKVHKVTGVVTQGRQDYNQWVKRYDVEYGNDGVQFKRYGSLSGNSDRNTKVGHILKPAITARYIRLRPTRWHGHISMRFDLYGCFEGIVQPTPPACMKPLVLSGSQMSASSQWHSSHGPANGRLNFHAGHGRTGAWSARANNKDQWLQADFGKVMEVRRCATQGRQDYSQWVKKYTVSYSYDGTFWTDYPIGRGLVVFDGNTDRYSVVGHNFNPPFSARFVRLNIVSWHGHISMRLQCYGCVKGSQVSPEKCIGALGPKSEQNPGSVLTASSMWDANHSPSRAKLGTTKIGPKRGAWSAKYNDKGQWIQMDFVRVVKVTRLGTQGRDDANQWVKSFKIKYGVTRFFEYYNKGQLFHGNSDRKTIVGHVLEPPIIARYIQVLPMSWYGHISMRLEFYGCTKGFPLPPMPACQNEFHLKDAQLSSSSQWDSNHAAANAKLHYQKTGARRGAWSSRYNDQNQWIQADLQQVSKITILATQGRSDARQWVKSFTVDYSVHGNSFQHYQNKKVFAGNSDQHTVVSHKLSTPIIARFLRFRPLTWYGHISMRVGLYGCTKGFVVPSPKCGLALGMESGIIPDQRISASSEWNSGHRAANARLNFKQGSGRTGAWSAKRNDQNQWLQVDFQKIAKIEKCATQGRSDYKQWVTKYSLSYSRDAIFWYDYPKEFSGNRDQSSVVTNVISPPIYARFVRIRPKAWYGHISMRAEFYGCTSGFQIPPLRCSGALGMQSKAIRDSVISASSIWDSHHGATRSRLNTVRQGRNTGAWSAKYNDRGQWLKVDFSKGVKLTGIATQGRQDANQWVKSYKLKFSVEGGHFEYYNGGKVFSGNSDRNTIVGHFLHPAIHAKSVKIQPVSWHSHISMRFELYGCPEDFVKPSGSNCENKFELKDAQLSSSSQWDSNHAAANAKLHYQKTGARRGAWSSRYNDQNQWIQADLQQVSKITILATQGRSDARQWVKSFTVDYSVHGNSFQHYQNKKVFAANSDQHTVVSHKLSTPIIARFLRFRPVSWYGHISMRVGLYGCTKGFVVPSPKCGLALGMESGIIPDQRISASSEWNSGHRAANARLNFKQGSGRTGAWSAKRNDQNQWLQVDFQKIAKIEKCATQGRSDSKQWVTKYSLSYSRDAIFWYDYPKEFSGNRDQSSVVTNVISPPIYARFVRIRPKAWYGHISMRAEFYGCTSGFHTPPLECAAALGMQSRHLPDNRISASSIWDVNHNAARARLNIIKEGSKTGAWSARYNNLVQWLQIDSDKPVKITGIATQGRSDYNQWVRSYKLQYSLDGGYFYNYNEGKPLSGNNDRNTIVGHLLVKPFIAKHIRVRPMSWYGHISMRMELYGCTKGFPVPQIPPCGGMIHLGDWMMSASTEWNSNHGASNAKLDFVAGGGKTGAWSARRNDVNQHLQVGFDREMKVTRISIQGRSDANQWVKTFALDYSTNGVSFVPYKERGIVKVFHGSTDRNTIVSHKLVTPVVGLAIRFRPRTWHGHISMRVGVYGCPTGKKPANPPCHSPMDVGVIMDRSGSIGSANFKKSQDFVIKMIRHFEYASSASRFGVIAYNSVANLIVKFSDKATQNPHALQNLVYGIRYLRGGTRTDRAISLANSHLYSSSGGYLSNRPNVLFVLTDGKTNRGSQAYSTVLRPLLGKKVKVIAVGVGSGINNRELLQIANNQSKYVFHVNDFSGLFAKLNAILKASCPT